MEKLKTLKIKVKTHYDLKLISAKLGKTMEDTIAYLVAKCKEQ